MSEWVNMKYLPLSKCAKFRNDRISSEKVTINNYISTENMLPDRGGVEDAASIPVAKTLSKYIAGDILLSNIRPYFKKIWIADKTGGCSNDVLVIKSNETNAKFLYYVLSDNNFFNYSTVTSKGTKMPRGSKSAIMKYLVPDIKKQDQTSIAEILSAYDDAIENNNRRIALLEKAAQELYREWFVRFRFPGYKKAKFVNGLPEGWEVVKLGDVVKIKGGKRLPLGHNLVSFSTKHPYIRIRDIFESKFISLNNTFEYIEDKTFNIIKRFIVNTGDILISIVGTIGSIACVGKSLDNANLTENCVKLVNYEKISKNYIYHFLVSEIGKGLIKAGIVGATQPKLPLYNIARIKLLKPCKLLLEHYDIKMDNLNSEIMNLQDQSQNLARQRDLLLPRLMSGKLEV